MSNSTNFTAVCLGNFDGVHRGHRFLLSQTVRLAAEQGLTPLCYTFRQHPSSVLGKKTSILTSREDRDILLKEIGIQPVEDNFSTVCHLSAEDFFHKILLNRLHAKAILCGEGHRFGKDAAGDEALLRQLCQRSGLLLSVLPPILENGRPISSSWVRRCIEEGDVVMATRLLGRYPSIEGVVIEGRKLGRKMGFPTINQRLMPGCVKPRRGVYLALVSIDRRQYLGALNIGIRPTIPGEESAETHILDYDGNLYGRTIRLHLVRHLRDEFQFDTVEQLKTQVLNDIAAIREIGAPLLKNTSQ